MINLTSILLLLTLSFYSGSSCAFETKSTKYLSDKLDLLFKQTIKKDAPGCAAAIFEQGTISYHGAFGMANIELKRHIDYKTQFRLASNSKQFTATIVAILAERKFLSLDDPLSKYFTTFPAYAASITLSDLIHHTSGLRDYFELSELAGIHPSKSFSKEYALKILSDQTATNFEPGTMFSYSNAGYLLLAQIIESVTQKSFKQVANELIFNPLAMSSSHFDNKSSSVNSNLAMGYLSDNMAFETKMDMSGAGGMISTIEDLAKWDGNFYANRLTLNTSFIDKLVTPDKLRNGTNTSYAFGLEILHHGSYEMHYHGGEMEGSLTEFIRIPEKKMSIAVLCNSNAADSFGLAMDMLNLILPLDVQEKLADKPKEIALSSQNAFSDSLSPSQRKSIIQQYIGYYWNESSVQKSQTIERNGELFLIRESGREQKLLPISENRFKVLNVPYKAIVIFSKNKSSKWDMKINFDNDQLISNLSQFEEGIYNTNELREFQGNFYSKELDIIYRVSLIKDKLNLSFANLTKIKLKNMMNNVFSYTPFYTQNTLDFQFDQDKNPAGFYLNSPRVKNVYFEKL